MSLQFTGKVLGGSTLMALIALPVASPLHAQFGRQADPVADFADRTGFTQIFDGKTMNNWDGTPVIWSVQDGALTGLSCPDKPAGTTFLIYTGSQPGNFELKAEVKLESGNSGIQYRSFQNGPTMGEGMPNFGGGRPGGAGGPGGAPGAAGGPGGPGGPGGNMQAAGGPPGGGFPGGAPGGPAASTEPFAPCIGHEAGPDAPEAPRPGGGAYRDWYVQGYQFEIAGSRTGALWEGGLIPGERGFMASPGQATRMTADGQQIIGTFSADGEADNAFKAGEWNQIHIIASGNTMMHYINGKLISVVVDENPDMQRESGVIAFQVEGTNMRVSYRDIWLKNL